MTEEERQRFLQAQLLEQQRGLGFSDVFNNMVIDPAKQGIQDIGNALSNWWDNTQAVDIDIPNMQISSPMVKDIYNAAGYLGDALVYPYTNFQENYVENIEAPAIAAGQNADKVGSGLVDMAALMLKGEDASQVRQRIYENLIGGAGNSLWSASSASDYSPLALMGGAIGGIRRVGNAGVDMARAARKLNLPKVSDELTNAVVKQNQIDAIGPPTTSAGYSFDPSMTAWDQLERIPDETFDVDADVIYDGARRYKDSTRDDINKRLSERGLTISSVVDSRASESQYWYVAPLSDPDDLIGTVRFSDHHDYFGGNDVDIRWGQKPDEITADILEKINLDNYVPFDERMNRLPPTTIVPKPFVATTDIGLNDIVSHDKFGRGKILSVDGNKAEVLFDDGKTKMMHSSFLTTINKPKISDELVDAVTNEANSKQPLSDEIIEAALLLQNRMQKQQKTFNINTGKVATKTELNPFNYQNTKLKEGYLSDYDVQQTDLGTVKPRFDADIEKMEGGIIIPLFGDRSSTGKKITGIGDIEFDQALLPDGGIDFMLGKSAQADGSLWASAPHIMNNIYNQAKKLSNKGEKDIYGVHVGMGPDGVDFATFAGESMAELMKFAPVKKADALKMDEFMKLRDPNWIGVQHPDLRDYIKKVKPEIRKSFIRYMDTAPAQAAGFPSPAIARKAVTDVTQFGNDTGRAGMATGKIDIDGLIDNPTVPHGTYTQQGTGKYTGQLPSMSAEELFSDDFAVMNKQVDKNNKPLSLSNKLYSLKTRLAPQELTAEKIDMLMRQKELRQ
jgi:hypothetical protein